jgi:hypothetical protein
MGGTDDNKPQHLVEPQDIVGQLARRWLVDRYNCRDKPPFNASERQGFNDVNNYFYNLL